MGKLKKIGLFLLGVVLVFGFNIQYAAIPIPYSQEGGFRGTSRTSTGIIDGTEISAVDPIGSGSSYIGGKSKGILSLPQPESYSTKLGYALALVQIAVNWTLVMLAFVALIFMLYNGFLVLSSGSDSKNATKGKDGIKTAIIAIAGVGLSWLIISAIIRLINNVVPEEAL